MYERAGCGLKDLDSHAGVTKCHNLRVLNKKKFFSLILRLSNQGASVVEP